MADGGAAKPRPRDEKTKRRKDQETAERSEAKTKPKIALRQTGRRGDQMADGAGVKAFDL